MLCIRAIRDTLPERLDLRVKSVVRRISAASNHFVKYGQEITDI